MVSRLQKIKSLDLSYQNIFDISILIESSEIRLLRGNPISDFFSVLAHQNQLRILIFRDGMYCSTDFVFLADQS